MPSSIRKQVLIHLPPAHNYLAVKILTLMRDEEGGRDEGERREIPAKCEGL